MHKKRYLLIALFIGCFSAFGANIKPFFSCSVTGLRKNILLFGARRKQEMVDFEFKTASFTDELMACVRWLEELNRQPWFKSYSHQVRVQTLASPEKQKVGRLRGRLKSKIYEFCQQSATCRVRFPYNLNVASFKGYLKRGQTTPFYTLGDKTCLAPLKDNQNRKPASVDNSPASFQKIRNWVSPLTNMEYEVSRLIDKHDSGTIFVSAMIASVNAVESLAQQLKKKPKLRVFLLINLNHMSVIPKLSHFLSYFKDNLFLIPVYQSPDFPGNYHYKGAVHLSKRGDFVFTSINYNSQSDSKLVDLGFSGSDERFGSGLGKLFISQSIDSCKKLKYLSCSLDLRFHSTHPARYAFTQQTNRSCEHLSRNSKMYLGFGRNIASPIVDSQNDAIVDLVVNHINQAKTSIALTSHHIGEPRVLDALLRAKNRGVRLHLFVAPFLFSEEAISHKIRDSVSYSRYYANSAHISHSKGILVDGTTLLIGTGNFTNSGLEMAKEYFFITKDKTALHGFKLLINTLAHLNGDATPYNVTNVPLTHDGKNKKRPVVLSLDEKFGEKKYVEGLVSSRRADLWYLKPQYEKCLKNKAATFFYSEKAAEGCAS